VVHSLPPFRISDLYYPLTFSGLQRATLYVFRQFLSRANRIADVFGCLSLQLESAADEIRKTRMERDRYRQLLRSLKVEKGITGNPGEEFLLPPMPMPQ